VFVAIAVAAAIVATAAASGPLFVASTRTAALHVAAANACPEASMPALDPSSDPLVEYSVPASTVARLDAAVRAGLRDNGLPAPYLVAQTNVVAPGIASVEAGGLNLFSRPGALAHVQRRQSVGGPGVWVPDTFATQKQIRPGEQLATTSGRLRVAGIYRDLAGHGFHAGMVLPRYWCTWTSEILPSLTSQPPPFLIADLATVVGAADQTYVTWYSPIGTDRLTVPQARSALRHATAANERPRAAAPTQPLFVQPSLPSMVAGADRTRNGVRGPVTVIDVAAVVVALLLLAGAGVFWTVRRRRELRLLTSRGVGPAGLAAKAVLEVAPAVVVGLVGGWFAGRGLVRALGPAAQLDADAPWLAVATTAIAGAAGLLLVATIGAAASREHRHHGWRRIGIVPWELLLIAAAALIYRQIVRRGAASTVLGTVQVSWLAIAFPLLGFAGALLLVTRVLRLVFPLLRRPATRLGPASYLAVRRIAGSPLIAVGLVVGTAMPCGLLVYASSSTSAIDHSVRTKYETFVGADHAYITLAAPPSTVDTRGHGTDVSLISVEPQLSSGEQATVLGIDPATFTRFAFGGAQLRDVVALLRPTAPGAAVPAILVNADQPGAPTSVTLRNSRLPIQIVARRAVFPGLRQPFAPMLVVDRAALARVDPFVNRVEEVWTTNAQRQACLAAVGRDDVGISAEISPTSFLGHTGLLPIGWIGNYLRALAVLAGVIAATGLVLALGARTRERTASYVLARRMGLTGRVHRRSLAIELGIVVGVGWIAGAALAIADAALVDGRLDVNADFPPAPSLVTPVITLGASAMAVAVVIAVAAWITQRVADRANPADVMRLE